MPLVFGTFLQPKGRAPMLTAIPHLVVLSRCARPQSTCQPLT